MVPENRWSDIESFVLTFVMDNQLKVGDVVQLNSGGPKMTVTLVGDSYGTPTVWCVWFEGTKKIEGQFPIGTVKPA